MTNSKEAQTELIFQQAADEKQHPMLAFPVIRQLIQAFRPDLLNNSAKAKRTLDAIAHYLSDGHALQSDELEATLPEELYTALYGLKSLLRKRNWNIVNWVLEDSKARFGDFLRQELEEE